MPKGRVSKPKKAVAAGTRTEDLAVLVNFVRSLPPRVGDKEKDTTEPPPKRIKTTGSSAIAASATEAPSAICIAREDLILPAFQTTLPSELITVTRQNVGGALALRLSREHGDWHLTLFSRVKARGIPGFRVSFQIPGDYISPEIESALRLADSQGINPGSAGCLWASTDIYIDQNSTSVELKLHVQVWWNECPSVWVIPQTRSQPTFRRACIRTWYPDLEHDSTALSWSPQDFYEAAHVPKKETLGPELSAMKVPKLETKLYPFQKRAVHWLLQREGARWLPSEEGLPQIQKCMPPEDSELPISFAKVKDVDGEDFYMSPLLGVATRDISPFVTAQNIRGGILAEEMGLGKTVEIISLILLHQRLEGPMMVYDPYLGRNLLATSATLIVTPSSLLDQWLSELERHSPVLNVLYYPGLKKATNAMDEEELALQMSQRDVVITTYEVLRAEVWLATDEPNRSMRNSKQYERPKSPLVQLSWWRVCIDEAQMVENWTSNTAVLARRIPRINAWGITGTPVKDDVQKDLRGLLTFLRFEPYASYSKIWKTLTTVDKGSFKKLFNLISMRHSKSLVRDEIEIPPQRRYVITMPFSAVEEQHYQSLFQELTATCGLDVQGNPLEPDWDPENPAVMSAMRMALDRLRQTALHPEVGNRNRRAGGQKIKPMRTVAEVLDAMLDQSELAVRTDQRGLLALRLTRGQILAGQKRVKDALAVWEEVREESTAMVDECRKQLDLRIKEADKSGSDITRTENDEEEEYDAENDGRDDVAFAHVNEARRRLRSALEIQHKAIFFCANAYFSIKSDEEMTKPDTDEYQRLEQLEVESYAHAKEIRKQVLQESFRKAKKLMDRLTSKATQQLFAVIPESRVASSHGIESGKVVDALDQISEALNEQANILDDWREHVIQLLLKDLVDDDSGEATATGEEYEESTKLQDEILVYLQVLRAAVADRNAVISGQKLSYLVEQETKAAIRLASNHGGPSPKKLLELFKIREAIRPKFDDTDLLSSLKGIVSKLRALSVNLRHDAASGSARAAAELAIVTSLLKLTQLQQTEQSKAATAMEQEVERFNETLNARIDFYRQLQGLSDTVAELEGATDDGALEMTMRQEKALQTKLAIVEAKHRYLLHLKETDNRSEEQRMCIICQSSFSIGVLTVCGHQFCKECITLWFKAHRNCPVCKRHLRHSNLHDITLKPQQLKVHSEANRVTSSGISGGDENPSQAQTTSPTSKKTSAIYTEFSPEKLDDIKNIELDGPSFTTKVDFLIRHLLWLRSNDPGAKSIIFSQYKEFLDVLSLAFKRYRIGFASFDGAQHGVSHFRDDPSTEVFLLHARAHASGLNLVTASHVFLCEPLLNTALELQAIARVDRIGQLHETTVWLYIVEGTVEESIHALSVQRRLEHMGRSKMLLGHDDDKGKSKESTPELLDANLDAANSMEMQQAQLSKLMGKNGVAGEAVDKKDLWTCLFGGRGATATKGTEGDDRFLVNNPVTRAFLTAEAAEGRMKTGDEE